jgi:regulator of protease activity HflC (stomatin/prohibitin superfamily)
MLATEIQEHARRLLEAHGDKAVAEAAQKAKALEDSGAADDAKVWRKIEAALKQMRGPHST